MNKPIEIEFEFLGEKHTARFWRSEYVNNGNLYVGAITYDEEYKCWEPWSDVTVNLPDIHLDKDEAFINVNNCAPEIIKALKKAKLIKDTNVVMSSGYCIYPLYKFTKKFFEGMVEYK